MIVCVNCGVDLETSMNYCPLCGVMVIKKSDENNEKLRKIEVAKQEKWRYEIKRLNLIQKKRLARDIISVILLSILVISVLLNFLISGNISWSWYIILICSCLFSYLWLFTSKKAIKLLRFFGSAVISGLFLVFLDIISGRQQWSLFIGIPLATALFLLSYSVYYIVKRARRRVFNLIALVFLAAGLLTLLIDALVSNYLLGVIKLSWSLIVFISIIPVSSIMFILHVRLKKYADLKKFFHI